MAVAQSPYEEKRAERAQWWTSLVAATASDGDASLYDHPAILAAVEAIEGHVKAEGKVLVFGRFTRPLKALTDLLNAREMLRRLQEKRPWPRATVAADEWPVLAAARAQLGLGEDLMDADRRALEKQLEQQYRALENSRERFRRTMLRRIEEAVQVNQSDQRTNRLFVAFRDAYNQDEDRLHADHVRAVVARALQELLPHTEGENPPGMLARAFAELMSACCERNESDEDGDGNLDEEEAKALWTRIEACIIEEFDGRQGGFARLMNGQSKPETRRLLQMAFNRAASLPKVLVAQSMVGREGLNLHRACRVVVLLHPEWNPGIVEQQIGRIDRVGSLWSRLCATSIEENRAAADLPRILVRPVVFSGTYDEHNWSVLRERWDDLRAQLHGVVVSTSVAKAYSEFPELVSEVNDAAPDFGPQIGAIPSTSR